MVQFGKSVEFCGGCHVKSTGKIGFIRILSESSVAAGVRRIEAITGKLAEESIYAQEDVMNGLKAFFNNAKDITAAIRKTIEENDELRKQAAAFVKEQTLRMKDKLVASAQNIDGIKLIKSLVPGDIAPDVVKDLAFQIGSQLPENTLCLLGSKHDDKPLLTVMISKDLIADKQLHAGNLVREAAKLIKGGGGGAPHFATAGGKDTAGLEAALDKVVELAGL